MEEAAKTGRYIHSITFKPEELQEFYNKLKEPKTGLSSAKASSNGTTTPRDGLPG